MSNNDDLDVRKDAFGNDVFYDKSGNRVGETRTDAFGNKQIYNNDGERTGEIKKDAFGNDAVWNDSGQCVEKKDGKQQIPLGSRDPFPKRGSGCWGCVLWILLILYWVFKINWGSKIGMALAILMTIIEFNREPNHPAPENIIFAGFVMTIIFGLVGAGIWALVEKIRSKK